MMCDDSVCGNDDDYVRTYTVKDERYYFSQMNSLDAVLLRLCFKKKIQKKNQFNLMDIGENKTLYFVESPLISQNVKKNRDGVKKRVTFL